MSGSIVHARFVLLSSGLVDQVPEIDGIENAIRRSLVRLCPICDAFEAIDRSIAVLGNGDLGAREAIFLRSYSHNVTLLLLEDTIARDNADRLLRYGIDVVDVERQAITLGESTAVLQQRSDARREFDFLYLALGCDMQSRLALDCGAEHDAMNNLTVDAHQQTSIDGLYAAGDVVRGLNQIAIATAESAIAATAIHNRLRERDERRGVYE